MNLGGLWEELFGRREPAKIIGVGLNYRDHAEEQGSDPPSEPLFFAKFANTLRGPGDEIVLPRQSRHVDAEAELAIVIGKAGRHVPVSDALDLVAGYTCANDVTERYFQKRDGQWLRAKSFDSFCPLGPEVVSAGELGEADDLAIVQRLNGEVLQDSRTSQLIFGVRALVAHASTVFTLERGDVILTGTPAGVGVYRRPPVALAEGDEVEVEVEGIGVLRNGVVAEP